MMNKEDRLKETVIKSCAAGEMTSLSVVARLGISVRQVKRMKARYREIGEKSRLHGNCGRQPSKL